jgi:hypothetical protein
MQSYEHHIVEEALVRRHPYIQDPFTSEVDIAQITIAVFDRFISKFRDVLASHEEIGEPATIRDCLSTLGKLVSHQVRR